MTSRTQNSNGREKTDDDIFIEDFAREFFETDQSDNELLPEKTEVKQTDYKKEKRKYDESYRPKIRNSDREKSESKTSDSRQSFMKRFLELRDEFISLSDRLHDASMPKVSKKLAQVLTERQRLVKLLLDMEAPSSSGLSPGREEKRFHDQSTSRNGVSKHEFGMPKKTKSVHWSDEHLGGSIIQDPAVYENVTKPPPRYKMVDNQRQTRRRSHEKDIRDLDRCCCNMRIDNEMEYVKEILNEAAELRREACCMIWRAHYLEQLCDADGLIKHVYRSTSNVPTLPRYSHLYR